MRFRSLSQLSTKALLDRLRELTARDRHLTVEILEVLIEADWRRLWAKAGYPSMYAWCMAEFGYSEDQAAKRICAARQARKHPVILEMVADGRLHLSGLIVLARKLREAPERAGELLEASAHRSRRAIEALLAERFPQPDVPTQVTPTGPFTPMSPAPGRVEAAESPAPVPAGTPAPPAPGRVDEADPSAEAAANVPVPESAPAPGRVNEAPLYSRVTPTAPQRYDVRFTMDEAMHADLVRAQELLGANAGDDRVRDVFRRALSELVETLEKRKLAATEKPRPPREPRRKSAKGRHVPAHVRREVRSRDQDRCTFVAENGKRCESRTNLEFDHMTPVAKGGKSTTENLRLLCRAHNQLEADRALGEGFMHGIRERARCAGELAHASDPGAARRGAGLTWAPAGP